MKRVLVLALTLALLVSSAFSIEAQDTPLEEIPFFMTFVPNVQFAPVYAAIANGHAEANGLALSIEHGDENVGLDLIALNERPFGLISGEEVIKARANGRPVVYVYEWFQQYPVGVVADADGPIQSVSDLTGRKVGIPGRFGASYNGLLALLSANDLDESDILLEPIGFSAPDIFCLGGVEASVIYVNNEPLQIQQRADAGECGAVRSVQVFPVSAAVDMVSNGVVTNEALIAERPEVVQAMVSAFDAGLRDVITNPAAAYLTSAGFVEGLPLPDDLRIALEAAVGEQEAFLATGPDREEVAASRQALLARLEEVFAPEDLIQFRVLLGTIDLWDAERLGLSEAASWEATQTVLAGIDANLEAIVVDEAFTNQFLPDVAP